MGRLGRWLRGDGIEPIEIRQGGIGHNEVVPRIVIMTPDGLAIAPTTEEVLDAVLGPSCPRLTDQTLG